MYQPRPDRLCERCGRLPRERKTAMTQSMSMKPAALALAVAAALACGGVRAAGGSGGGGQSGLSGKTTTAALGGTTAADVPAEMPAEILVKARSSDALPRLLARYPLALTDRFGARPIFRFQVLGGVRVKDVVAAMSLDSDVLIAEPNATHRSPEARRNLPWAIGNAQAWAVQWAPLAMRLPQAQAQATGLGVRVAVLDTGVDRHHPLLAGRVLPGFDFVDYDTDPSEAGTPANAGWGHGTHVAGLVAMAAPGAQILPVRVLDADGVGNAWVLAEAMLYAIDPDGNPATDDGAQVINLSLGSLGRTRILDTIAQIAACAPAVPDDAIGDRSDPGYRDDELRCASNRRGAVVVAAAGNDASGSVKEYPAAEGAYGLLAVAASNAAGRLASFSNSGPWIDLAAPGDGITSALPGGGWGTWGGTSMAAPLVAGTAALIRSREPGLPAKDVAVRLKRGTAVLCGTRLQQLDAVAALNGSDAAPVTCR